MKQIRCELCGDNHLIKKDEFFECESCGTRYSPEEARKLFVSDTVSVEGDVKVKQTDFTIRAGVLERYNGSDVDITIPNNVVVIGANAFQDCIGIRSITIPESVIEIGDYAFYGCRYLDSIELPKSVRSIGSYAFGNCSSLIHISFADGISAVSEGLFWMCVSLENISLPESIISIGKSAFCRCDSLKSIRIPQSVQTISAFAFWSCQNLISIKIPEGVTNIGDSCFSYCTNLVSVSLPDSITSIGSYVFQYCSKLSTINLPYKLTHIGRSAFENCLNLLSVTIPDSVKEICDSAYSRCTGLARLEIKREPFFNGENQFSGCCNLSDILLGYEVRNKEWYYSCHFGDTLFYKRFSALQKHMGEKPADWSTDYWDSVIEIVNRILQNIRDDIWKKKEKSSTLDIATGLVVLVDCGYPGYNHDDFNSLKSKIDAMRFKSKFGSGALFICNQEGKKEEEYIEKICVTGVFEDVFSTLIEFAKRERITFGNYKYVQRCRSNLGVGTLILDSKYQKVFSSEQPVHSLGYTQTDMLWSIEALYTYYPDGSELNSLQGNDRYIVRNNTPIVIKSQSYLDWEKSSVRLRNNEISYWKHQGKCQHCGGVFKGIIKLKCEKCGKPKDY